MVRQVNELHDIKLSTNNLAELLRTSISVIACVGTVNLTPSQKKSMAGQKPKMGQDNQSQTQRISAPMGLTKHS